MSSKNYQKIIDNISTKYGVVENQLRTNIERLKLIQEKEREIEEVKKNTKRRVEEFIDYISDVDCLGLKISDDNSKDTRKIPSRESIILSTLIGFLTNFDERGRVIDFDECYDFALLGKKNLTPLRSLGLFFYFSDNEFSFQVILCHGCRENFAHPLTKMFHCVEHEDHDYCRECYPKYESKCPNVHLNTICDISRTFYRHIHERRKIGDLFEPELCPNGDILDKILFHTLREYSGNGTINM